MQVNGFDSLQFSRRIQERRIVAEDLQLQEHELAAADQTDLEVGVNQDVGSCLPGVNGCCCHISFFFFFKSHLIKSMKKTTDNCLYSKIVYIFQLIPSKSENTFQ